MALALMLFQQLSGINAVMFYLQDIFIAAGNEMEPPGMSAFIVCVVQVTLKVVHNPTTILLICFATLTTLQACRLLVTVIRAEHKRFMIQMACCFLLHFSQAEYLIPN